MDLGIVDLRGREPSKSPLPTVSVKIVLRSANGSAPVSSEQSASWDSCPLRRQRFGDAWKGISTTSSRRNDGIRDGTNRANESCRPIHHNQRGNTIDSETSDPLFSRIARIMIRTRAPVTPFPLSPPFHNHIHLRQWKEISQN